LDDPAFTVGPQGTEIHFEESTTVDKDSRWMNEINACGGVTDRYRVRMRGREMELVTHTRRVVGCWGPASVRAR
jgi:hypothetical protein